MHVVDVPIHELKPAEYNPRKWPEKECEDLKKSIQEFGLVEPLIVNSAPERKNIVIGGHFRLEIAKMLGFDTIPVFYVNIPDQYRERELNLRLNKNLGQWDWEMLANFDNQELLNVGFTEEDLLVQFGLLKVNEENFDFERLNVLEIQPPESPRLKNRAYLQFSLYEDYIRVKEAILSGKIKEEDLLNLL